MKMGYGESKKGVGGVKRKGRVVWGKWQHDCFLRMISEHGCRHPYHWSELRGKAKRYAPHYLESITNLVDRMSKAGYQVWFELGPNGGVSGGRWFAVDPKEEVYPNA